MALPLLPSRFFVYSQIQSFQYLLLWVCPTFYTWRF